MNEQQMIDFIGRLSVNLEQTKADLAKERAEYGNLLGLVARIKSGVVDTADVVLDAGSWKIIGESEVWAIANAEQAAAPPVEPAAEPALAE